MRKYSATENDFLIVSMMSSEDVALWNQTFGSTPRAKVAQVLCDRFNGVGADGLLFLQPSQNTDFHWEFFNRDGSSAEMCGNAARCVYLWAEQANLGIAKFKDSFTFSTLAGTVRVSRRSPDLIAVEMPGLLDHQMKLQVSLNLEKTIVEWINSGVPHGVIERSSLEPRPELLAWAQKLRHHPHFGPSGANITFFTRIDSQKIATITFERGVEEFTRSCGTGAVAAAWVAGQRNVDVKVPGGELRIEFASNKPQIVSPTLIGPAFSIGVFEPSAELVGRTKL